MIPFRISATSSAANASPSVTLERGAYRMRAPPARIFSETNHKRPAIRARKSDYITKSHLTVLIALLAFSCFFCFGMAYYLFRTRWEDSEYSPLQVADQQPQVMPVEFHQKIGANTPDPHEQFLAYLPHSGFHNQRIAFENALFLARFLNRTLLVPPIRLGDKPLRYINFDALYQYLALSDKHGLYHCARVPSYIHLPLECGDYFDYTHISWDWLVNLTDVRMQQRLFERWNMTDEWIHEHLNITQEDILTIKDGTPYQYRFLDTLGDISPSSHKFSESIYLPELAQSTRTKRLVHLGTLFGSSRLRLKNPISVSMRGSIRQSMSYSNPELVRAANSIAKSIGYPYLGVHVRLGDGKFRKRGHENARMIWWKLLHQILEYTAEETLDLERALPTPPKPPDLLMAAPHLSVDMKNTRFNLSLTHAISLRSSSPKLSCKGRLHTRRHYSRLNIPLFISTDVRDPNKSPFLAQFRRAFPCIFYLSDFPADTYPLERLQNADDGVMLSSFLLPFLDAMVAAHAWKVVGTENSTFSHFVQDVLWTTYHGRPIVQRG